MEQPGGLGDPPGLIWLNTAVDGGSAAWRVAHLVPVAQQRVNELVDIAAFANDCNAAEIDIDVMCGGEDLGPTVRRGKRAGGSLAVDVRRFRNLDDDAVVADLMRRVGDLLVALAGRRGCSQKALEPLLALRQSGIDG